MSTSIAESTSNGDGSSPAATTYRNAIHRKAKGTLLLDARSMTFRPDGAGSSYSAATVFDVPWSTVSKHQVSPASHPKCLLKLVLLSGGAGSSNGGVRKKKNGATDGGGGLTFALPTRPDLERIRKDVSARLSAARRSSTSSTQLLSGRKRPHPAAGDSAQNDARTTPPHQTAGDDPDEDPPATPPSERYVDLDETARAVTRASLLASDPGLRAQHKLLVETTGTLTEDDFWSSHSAEVADEYARIAGKARKGTESSIRSSLNLVGNRGIIRLVVEEMRQIFLLYPAVHRAYEEKVPLELSEEQFWRRYLESEYFHRDRGRIGGHLGKTSELERKKMGVGGDDAVAKKKDAEEEKKQDAAAAAEDEAKTRLAAAGTDDIFSRYDALMRRSVGGKQSPATKAAALARKKLGTKLAVGQFDLASTAMAERGERALMSTRDLHPSFSSSSGGIGTDGGSAGDDRPSRVVGKYNRHWAVVLHPDRVREAGRADAWVAAAAGKSTGNCPDGGNGGVDDDAKARGGVGREMERLVSFADADEANADHARGIGGAEAANDIEDGDADAPIFQELSLKNVGAYSGETLGGRVGASAGPGGATGDAQQMRVDMAKYLAGKMRTLAEPLLCGSGGGGNNGGKAGSTALIVGCFNSVELLPPAAIGRRLLSALTEKMASDAKTEADARRMAGGLPDDFRAKLTSFFRRSSELLRHFFGLRRAVEAAKGRSGGSLEEERRKLTKIVKGMEVVYAEMEEMRSGLPQTESGEIMRKMCNPLMDQLDDAFKLHREAGSGGRGGGGFVTVEEL